MSPEDRIAELEERIAMLTAALGQDRLLWGVPLGLRRSHGRMLACLMKLPVVARDTMVAVLWHDAPDMRDPRTIDVLMSQMRFRLRPHGVQVETLCGVGWRLAPDMKLRVRAIVADYRRAA